MEIFELRYFFEVAKLENIQRAAKALRVSPGSLSKAIARIEDELGAKLFARAGRNIRLTDQGKLLKLRASQIIDLEEAARVEIAGAMGQLRVTLAGPEVLLTKMGLEITADLRERYPNASFEYHSCEEERALEEVSTGEAHIALVTGDVPADLTAKVVAESTFVTVVGRGHALYARAKADKPVAVEDVLQHPFVSPSRPILGKVGLKQSLDGWRDDVFMRNVTFYTTSIKLLETLLVGGQALAYLPDYYAERLDVAVLTVTGCPYSCAQKIRMVARRPKTVGWLNQLFHSGRQSTARARE
jgi:DNA-binding transcriptional LysR family regulator